MYGWGYFCHHHVRNVMSVVIIDYPLPESAFKIQDIVK